MLEIEQRILKPQDLEKVLISFFFYTSKFNHQGVCVFFVMCFFVTYFHF